MFPELMVWLKNVCTQEKPAKDVTTDISTLALSRSPASASACPQSITQAEPEEERQLD